MTGLEDHSALRAHAVTSVRASSAVVLAAFAALAFSAPCAAQTAPAPDILTYKGADREQKILEGAKKEGEVVIYSAMIVNQALRPLTTAFSKKYPFLKMTYWRADSENLTTKVSAEVRANNLVADVIEGTGVGELASEAGLVLPYFTPMLARYPDKYHDPQGLWTPTRLSYFSLAYNTKLVPADKVPKTYDDLLDPMWKGKMAWRIGSSSGTPLFITNLRTAWGEEKAMAYFKKLAEQKLVNFGSGSARTLVDRVIAGEYPIALNIFAHHPLISAAKGAPVNSKLLDPVVSTAATMVIPKGVRHPNAALLLIDYILSDEGQAILAGADYFPSQENVPPKDSLKSVVPKQAGVPENFVNPDTLITNNDSSEKIFQDLFR